MFLFYFFLKSIFMYNHKKVRRPNTLEAQIKVKRFDPAELKAWNSLYSDIQFKNKKHNSQKIFDGKVQADQPNKEAPIEEYDIEKKQKPKPHKKPKKKNPKVFQEKNKMKK